MIVLAALLIVWRALEGLVRGPHIERAGYGLILIAAAMLINGLMGFFLVIKGKRNGSITLEADGKHLLSDAITSLAVLVALSLVLLTNRAWIDPVAALCVAIYIVYMALGLLRRSVAGLMDEQDLGHDEMIRGILDSHVGPAGKEPRICSYHKLRHRHSGRYTWVDFHIMIPADLDIERGHKMASAIEYEIELAVGEGNATAHVEPCHAPDCVNCHPAPAESGRAPAGG